MNNYTKKVVIVAEGQFYRYREIREQLHKARVCVAAIDITWNFNMKIESLMQKFDRIFW